MIWNVAFESLLARMSKHAFVTGFADDGCALAAGANIDIMQRHIQSALRVAERWAAENGLAFAPEKTVLIHFHRKHKPSPPPRTTLNNVEIALAESTKYLGMLLTRNLSWNAHIEQKLASANHCSSQPSAIYTREWASNRTLSNTCGRPVSDGHSLWLTPVGW